MKKILTVMLMAFVLGIFLPPMEAQKTTGQPVTPAKVHKKHHKHHRHHHHHHHHHHKKKIIIS